MRGLECPHCGQRALPVWRKLLLGPAVSATCKVCGKKISVSSLALLVFLPFAAALVASGEVGSFAVKAGLWAGGVLLVLGVWYWVPLQPR
jgi:hypothetical protein